LAVSLNETAARLDRTIHTLTEERNLSSRDSRQHGGRRPVVNASERLLFANPALRKSWASTCPAIGKRACGDRQTNRAAGSGAPGLKGEPRVETEIVTGTLRQRFFAVTVASVSAAETSGAVIVLHDITELRRLERVGAILSRMSRTN